MIEKTGHRQKAIKNKKRYKVYDLKNRSFFKACNKYLQGFMAYFLQLIKNKNL